MRVQGRPRNFRHSPISESTPTAKTDEQGEETQVPLDLLKAGSDDRRLIS